MYEWGFATNLAGDLMISLCLQKALYYSRNFKSTLVDLTRDQVTVQEISFTMESSQYFHLEIEHQFILKLYFNKGYKHILTLENIFNSFPIVSRGIILHILLTTRLFLFTKASLTTVASETARQSFQISLQSIRARTGVQWLVELPCEENWWRLTTPIVRGK